MATALEDQYAASQRSDFLGRVTAAIANAAQAVYTEGTGVTNHAVRASFASKVAISPAAYAPAFSVMLSAQAIDTTSTDAQINSMVSSIWNTFAGA